MINAFPEGITCEALPDRQSLYAC